MARVKTHTFSTGTYRIVTDSRVDGYCQTPDEPGKQGSREIVVQNYLTGLRRLEVILHEALHAEFPWMGESVVTRAARVIARLLWRLEYRPGGK